MVQEAHSDLSLKVAHGLEVDCAKGLCPTNVASFYTDLIKHTPIN
jgi:hypothetical protein